MFDPVLGYPCMPSPTLTALSLTELVAIRARKAKPSDCRNVLLLIVIVIRRRPAQPCRFSHGHRRIRRHSEVSYARIFSSPMHISHIRQCNIFQVLPSPAGSRPPV